MTWLRVVAARIRELFAKPRLDAELDEELRTHCEMLAEENMRRGMPHAEARRAAKIALGGIEQTKEAVRDGRGLPQLDVLLQDVRFGGRMLAKSPGITFVIVLTLALGIGATTAIFTLVHQVMLSSLPVAKPEQLWRIGDAVACCYADGYTQGDGKGLPPNDWNLFSWDTYKLFRADTPGFERLAAFQIGEGNAELAVRRAGSGAPVEERDGEYVSGNFFETFAISSCGTVHRPVFSRADQHTVSARGIQAFPDSDGMPWKAPRRHCLSGASVVFDLSHFGGTPTGCRGV